MILILCFFAFQKNIYCQNTEDELIVEISNFKCIDSLEKRFTCTQLSDVQRTFFFLKKYELTKKSNVDILKLIPKNEEEYNRLFQYLYSENEMIREMILHYFDVICISLENNTNEISYIIDFINLLNFVDGFIATDYKDVFSKILKTNTSTILKGITKAKTKERCLLFILDYFDETSIKEKNRVLRIAKKIFDRNDYNKIASY